MPALQDKLQDKKAFFLSAAQAMAKEQASLDKRGTPYAIPRAKVEWRFAMEILGRGRVFFWGHDGPSPLLDQRLSYDVLAVPSPAPKPGEFSLELQMPPYLLPWGEERRIAQEVFPESKASACLPLAGGNTYFVIHLADDEDDDRHCIHQPESKVIAFARAGGQWNYQPFRELFDSLRQQQASDAFVSASYSRPDEVGWGWDHFDDFVANLWDGYTQAMEELAQGDLHYDIPAFEARFRYSQRKEVRWIDNEVHLSYDRSLGRMTARLAETEFLLRGEARQKLLDLLRDRPFFANPPAEALILSSIAQDSDDTGFVAVWPTPRGDDVFSFRSDGFKITDGPNLLVQSPAGQVFLQDKQYRPIRNFFLAYRAWRLKTFDE